MLPATAVWQQQAGRPQLQIAIHRPVSRLFFFLSPYLWWENNQTTPACWKIYWNCIAFELRILGGFFGLFWFFFFFAVLFYFMSLLWWENYRTTSEAPSPGLEAVGWTPKFLRLKLHCIWTWRVFFIFHFVLFYTFFKNFYSYLYSFYFIFSILSLSL
jgi:hypothetical protein